MGAYWQSDVDASRTAASIGFCALQGSPAFTSQMQKAQAEYGGEDKPVRLHAPCRRHSGTPCTRAYRLDGIPATDDTCGILIQNQQKIIKK